MRRQADLLAMVSMIVTLVGVINESWFMIATAGVILGAAITVAILALSGD